MIFSVLYKCCTVLLCTCGIFVLNSYITSKVVLQAKQPEFYHQDNKTTYIVSLVCTEIMKLYRDLNWQVHITDMYRHNSSALQHVAYNTVSG